MAPPSRWRPLLKLGLTSVVGLLLLAWLLHAVDPMQARRALQAVPAPVWLLAALGMALSHLLRAGRLRVEWAGQIDLPWRHAWGLLVRHSAWVVLVPMRAGEGYYLWAMHRHHAVPLARAAFSLLRLRLQDVAVLAVLAVALWLPATVSARMLVALLLLAACVWWFPAAVRWLRVHWASRQPDGGTVAAIPAPAPRLLYAGWLYALANWLVKLAALAGPLALAAGLPVAAALSGALGGEWGAALPLQPPAGFGPYEAGVVAGVAWAPGRPDGMALTQLAAAVAPAALAVHLLALAVTLASAALAAALGWGGAPTALPVAETKE